MGFFKRIFSKQMIRRIVEQIEKRYIFVQLDLEHYYEPFFERDLLSRTAADLDTT